MSRRQYLVLLALSIPLVMFLDLPVAIQWLVCGSKQVVSDITPEPSVLDLDRVAMLADEPLPSVSGQRRSDAFPDVELTDQNGRKYSFRRDLVSGKIVCIALFYTKCTGTCPGTIQTMKRLRETLKDEFPAESVRFIAVTLDPENDTPNDLREYAEQRQINNSADIPEWLFCTGRFEDIERLRFSLGLYELDPVLDADRTQHGAVLTIGNDRTDRWVAMPSGLKFDDLSETFLRIAGTTERQRFATHIARSAEFMKTSATGPASQSHCIDLLQNGDKDCCVNPSECCSLPDAEL